MSLFGINVAVRRIHTLDAGIIGQVAALEGEAFGRGGLNEWHLPVIARHGRLYVLGQGDRIIGAASLIKDWLPSKAYLFDLVVAKDMRRRGYGHVLMEKVIAELAREGVERLELTVAPDNQEAVGLYRQLGFETKETLADEYGQGQDRWRMALKLTRS